MFSTMMCNLVMIYILHLGRNASNMLGWKIRETANEPVKWTFLWIVVRNTNLACMVWPSVLTLSLFILQTFRIWHTPISLHQNFTWHLSCHMSGRLILPRLSGMTDNLRNIKIYRIYINFFTTHVVQSCIWTMVTPLVFLFVVGVKHYRWITRA